MHSFELTTHTRRTMSLFAFGLFLAGFLPAGLVLALALKGLFSTTSMIVLLAGFPCLLLGLVGSQAMLSLRKGHQLNLSATQIHWKTALFSLDIPIADLELEKSSQRRLALKQSLSFKNNIVPFDFKLSAIPLHWFQDGQSIFETVRSSAQTPAVLPSNGN